MIELLKYLILGIIQGITEPIPVSSSGHILIFKKIIENITNQTSTIDFETFAILTNFGSLIAILIIFRKDIIRLIKSFFMYLFNKERQLESKSDFDYCLKIVLATIPAGLIGIIVTKLGLLYKLEENMKFLGLMLVITSLFLYLIKDFKGVKNDKRLSFKDAIIIGIYQMIALIPGISRSGATIVGGMFRGLKRETAFTFSFMLYIPISLATMVLGIKNLTEISISSTEWLYYIIGVFMAFIFTFVTTKWYGKIVKEGKLIYFSIYCLIVGLLVMIFL